METTATETTILISNDRSVILTDRRLVQDLKYVRKEIELRDITGWELEKKTYAYYKILGIVFIILFLTLLVLNLTNSEPFNTMEPDLKKNVFFWAGLLTAAAVFYMFVSKKKTLKIFSRYTSLEIPANSLSKQTLDKFLYHLSTETGKQKQ